ncbi:phage tail tape measure protein [Streptomyces mobaraensis]|uniref:phage tail tape measure protein n=1 Tax=Streptomyces mobaraensis TaxID=35621 RepID=UPI0033C85880
MALRVGELLATLTVDASGLVAGLRRAEGNLRSSGTQMAGDADHSGQQAGQRLGDGVADGARSGGERAAGLLRAGLAKVGAAAAGIGIGAALMGGIGKALEQGKVEGKLRAQMGSSGPMAADYGKAAGVLYSKAIVDSVEDGAAVLKGIAQQGLLPPDATQSQIQEMGRRVADTAAVMGEDVGAVSRAVGTMLKSGIAKNAAEAMDILVRGTQVGANAAEDLLDTYSEYPTIFRQLGLDAQTSMGLMSQGLKGGARDADVVADALKEFTLQAQGMSDKTKTAYADLGLSGEKMQAVFQKGGPAAGKAFSEVITKLRAVKDPAKKSEIAIGLFGTKFEDMQQAIYSLDPAHAVDALGQVKGSTDKAGDAMRDNASTKVEAFKRALEQKIVGFIGTQVIPAAESLAKWIGEGGIGRAFQGAGRFISEHSTSLTIAASVITLVMLPSLVALATQAGITTVAVVTGWATQSAAGVVAAGRFIATNVMILGGWLAQGAAAGAAALRVVAAWAIMGAQSLIQAARMAAAWVIAMGPVGWITAAVLGLVALVIANWDAIKSGTAAAWDWTWGKIKAIGLAIWNFFLNWTIVGNVIKHWDDIRAGTARIWSATVEWVRAIPGRIAGFFLNWEITATIARHWSNAKQATISKALEIVAWVRDLPGRIRDGLGSLNNLLSDKGRDAVRGLWVGIKSMASWIKDKVTGWARDVIPGPIAKVLKIHSPSRVTAELGKFAGQGLITGLTGTASQVESTSKKLAELVAKALSPKTRKGRALAREVAQDTAELKNAVKARDRITGALKQAEDKLKELRQSWNQTRDQVAGNIVQPFTITRAMGGGLDLTAGTILDRLAGDATKARAFAQQLASLRKRGLSGSLIEQIASAGVQGGGATAEALLRATPAQIKALNKQQAALADAGRAAGATTADALYGAGINAAKGVVAGLKAQRAAIETAMLEIAKGMQRAIKRALGIHSPSRVMAAIGERVPEGLVAGIRAGAPAVDRTMRSLVPTPSAPPPAFGRSAAVSAPAGPTVHIEHWHAGSATASQTAAALAWHAKARG